MHQIRECAVGTCGSSICQECTAAGRQVSGRAAPAGAQRAVAWRCCTRQVPPADRCLCSPFRSLLLLSSAAQDALQAEQTLQGHMWHMLLLHRRRLWRFAVYSRSSGHLSLSVSFWRSDSANVYPLSSTRLCRRCCNPFSSSSGSNQCYAQGPTHREHQADPSRRFPQQSSLEAPNTGLQVFIFVAAVATTWHDMAEQS